MVSLTCRFVIGAAFLAALLSQAPAQDERQPAKKDEPNKQKVDAPKNVQDDVPKKGEAKPPAAPARDDGYRQFFRKPETVMDFWRAIHFELEVGRPDLAARHLRALMARQPSEAELLELEEEEGMARLLALRQLRKWDDDPKADQQAKQDVEALIQGASAALEKHLADKARIAKLVKNLASDDEDVRAFALKELYRSGARILPAFLEQLRDASGDTRAHLLSALPQLKPETVPALVAALDIPDTNLRVDLIGALQARRDQQAVPFLWYLAGSPRLPASVQARARQALTALLGLPADNLPLPKVALTRQAERYYKHEVPFADPQRVVVWRWDGKGLVASTLPASKAEEYYGLRFARQALDLDPAYQPAQVIFLSLALEKAAEPLGLDRPLTKGPPEVRQLLASVNPELVTAVLDRALTENRIPVILAAARALGALADVRALRPTSRGDSALVRALNYPDRRVQLVAADALLRIPGQPANPAAARVVEVLRRQAAAEPVARVLIADGDRARALAVADGVRKAGFEPVVASTGREAMRRLKESADYDVVFLSSDIMQPELAYVLGELRADLDVGLLPVIITTPVPSAPVGVLPPGAGAADAQRQAIALRQQARQAADQARRDEGLREFEKKYRKVRVLPGTTDHAAIKGMLLERVAADMGRSPADADLLKRLLAERQDHSDRALVWFGHLARGEVPGYDIRPAADTLLAALRPGAHGDDALLGAIAAVGRLPGSKPQTALTALVLDAKASVPVRAGAAQELVRHIQQHGPALGADQAQALAALAQAPQTDAGLRANVAGVLGTMRPDPGQVGERLKGYVPPPAAQPPTAQPPKK